MAKKLVRTSRVNQFLRRLVRRFGPASHEEFAQPILLHTARKMAQLVWQRRASEARLTTALADANGCVTQTDAECKRLRATMDHLSVQAHISGWLVGL